MKALVIEKPGTAVVRETERPRPSGAEVLIEVSACGVCGTDVHIFRGEYLGGYPVTPGHELAGTVVECGPQARRFKPGDRVAVEPNISCDSCPACLSNRQNFCEGWQAVGVTRPGGMAQYVCAPEKGVFGIGSLSFSAGAFVEPLSCVLHGIERARVQPADTVLVLGAGPIGVLLMKTAIVMGASSLTVVDRTRSRLDFARVEGGKVVQTLESLDALPADGFDLVVDATGVPAVMERTTAWARPGGRILLFGVPPAGARLSIDAFAIFRKGLTLLSSYTSVRNSIQAVRFLQAGRIDVSRLVSHELPLERFADGVRMIEKGEGGVMKVLMKP